MARYAVVYIIPGCCTPDVPSKEIEMKCDEMAQQGYALKDVYTDTTFCNPKKCCMPSKQVSLVFVAN
ncbi:MAG: hypothetical protein ACTSRK_01890 [Promethearchaeota archaeon]